MRLALFQPDQPGNVGTILRLGACLAVPVDIVAPCGFPFSERRMARAGLDYLGHADFTLHADWAAFRAAQPGRLVLLTTRGSVAYTQAAFAEGDVLLLGQESVGAPDFVHEAAALRVRIPMRSGLRSINVALAAAMVAGEALRQTAGFPA
jgi:tRNA (cytidine/uridine-2'-O-)-methyltransferase